MNTPTISNLTSPLAEASARLLDRTSEQASTLAHRGLDAVREGSHQLRASAQHASDSTVSYIRHEPVKSVLFAAAAGAVLMGLLMFAGRTRHGA
ncbi:MAG: hypothetical protein U5L05_04160 [Rubrivivax sp.]|nr:hypothetical protein [Rubrivivax sp.]